MTFDRFAICSAYSIVASQWHSGQSSKGYQKLSQLSRMGYRPGPSEGVKGLDELGRRAAAKLLWTRRREIRASW